MRMQKVSCLLELASRGAEGEFVPISSRELGEAIGRSQQTASRLMVSMEKEGMIARRRVGKGQSVMITEAGFIELRELHRMLSKIFEGLVMEGEVFTGIGEGAYYMSQDGYRSQFRERMGFDPFPGTLNLRVSSCAIEEIRQKPGIKIDSFVSGDRSFGGGRCYRVRIGPDIDGAIFLPDRTHYPADVVEIVSPLNLRMALEAKDGDVVCLRVLSA